MSSIQQLRNEQREKRKSCFVLGYTGEVGKELTKELALSQIYEKVVLIGRRRVEYPAGGVLAQLEQRQIDFDNIDPAAFKDLHVGFCALGTTLGKAGKDGFYKVDHDYITNAANAARKNSCEHFNVVTSMGANEYSWFFYPKVKGQVERELSNLQFSRLSIYRPGMLLCDREEARFLERCAGIFFNVVAQFSDYGSAATSVVARAMVNASVIPFPVTERCRSPTYGSNVEVLENADIHEVAKRA